MELAMVGAIYRRNPTAAIVLEESGIKTAKDLEGKSIGIAPGAPSSSNGRPSSKAASSTRTRSR
jgi:ABC-type nitrate/sulfonate/bicarbonate transport system substrate-binding protein